MITLTTAVESARSKASGQNINRETLWIKFHEFTSSEDFITKWEEFVKNLNTTIPLYFISILLIRCLKVSLKTFVDH